MSPRFMPHVAAGIRAAVSSIADPARSEGVCECFGCCRAWSPDRGPYYFGFVTWLRTNRPPACSSAPIVPRVQALKPRWSADCDATSGSTRTQCRSCVSRPPGCSDRRTRAQRPWRRDPYLKDPTNGCPRIVFKTLRDMRDWARVAQGCTHHRPACRGGPASAAHPGHDRPCEPCRLPDGREVHRTLDGRQASRAHVVRERHGCGTILGSFCHISQCSRGQRALFLVTSL